VRQLLVAAVAAFSVALVGMAWAITGETTVTATDGGKPIPETKISLTFKTDTGKTIRKTSTTNHRKVKIPDGTKKVDIVVTTRRKKEVRTDIDVGLLIGRDYEIEIPGGSGPPDTALPDRPGSPGDPTGTLIGGGGGGKGTVCNDWHTRQVVTKGGADPLGENPDECFSVGGRASIYFGISTRVHNDWMAGVEADVGWSSNKRTVSGIPGTIGGVPGVTPAVAANDRVTLRESWDWSLRARFGRFVTPSTVVYLTAGLAAQWVEATVACSAAGACGVNGIAPFVATRSNWMVGGTVGAGVESAVTDRWIVRAEYRYSDFGDWSPTIGSPAALSVNPNIHMETHTGMLGIAYKLGR